MPLFGSPVDKARTMIADAIKSLGASPDAARAGTDTWLVQKGSAAVLVRLVAQDPKSKFAFIQVVSPVMKVPPAADFTQKLLHLNFEMGGLATFSLTPNNEVHLTTARTIEGISPTEIAQLVAQVAHFSDLYDDQLLNTYGRQHAIHAGQKS